MAERGLQARASATVEPGRFVKITSSGAALTVAHAGANERAIGVTRQDSRAYNDASHADSTELVGIHCMEGEEVLLTAGGSISAGELLKSDANGQAVAIAGSGTTIQEYGALALEDAASGETFRAILRFGAYRPALA